MKEEQVYQKIPAVTEKQKGQESKNDKQEYWDSYLKARNSIGAYQKPVVKFQNEKISDIVYRLLKACSCALEEGGEPEEIAKMIGMLVCMLNMKYTSQWQCVDKVSVGDIVHMNYGPGLHGEITENCTAIVFKVMGNMVDTIPVTMTPMNGLKYIQFDIKKDTTYYTDEKPKNKILTELKRVVRKERIYRIVGKLTPEFFETLKTAMLVAAEPYETL